MKKILIICSLIILILGCEVITQGENTQNKAINIEQHLAAYEVLKTNILSLKKARFQKKGLSKTQKIALGKDYLSNVLIDSIIPFWCGTPWDFNGHTKEPRNGEIACGYFITTPLKDMGIHLNRVKLAQQPASGIINKLCASETIKRFSKIEKLEKYLAEKVDNNEVLILGLDYHVGFVLKRNQVNYFIHSNYINRRGVEQEILNQSKAIASSKTYMIGNVSKNNQLILDWLGTRK